jgi:hypothetical protein
MSPGGEIIFLVCSFLPHSRHIKRLKRQQSDNNNKHTDSKNQSEHRLNIFKVPGGEFSQQLYVAGTWYSLGRQGNLSRSLGYEVQC